MKTLAIGVAMLLAAGATSNARAQATEAPTSGVETVTVSYADLTIDHPSGARALHHRLRSAARRVCDEPNRVIADYRVRHVCVKRAVADALLQVAADRSTRVANGRTVTLAVARTAQQR